MPAHFCDVLAVTDLTLLKGLGKTDFVRLWCVAKQISRLVLAWLEPHTCVIRACMQCGWVVGHRLSTCSQCGEALGIPPFCTLRSSFETDALKRSTRVFRKGLDELWDLRTWRNSDLCSLDRAPLSPIVFVFLKLRTCPSAFAPKPVSPADVL
jgi:hypothetical protein